MQYYFHTACFIEEGPLDGEVIYDFERYRIIGPSGASSALKPVPRKDPAPGFDKEYKKKTFKTRYFTNWNHSKVEGFGEITGYEFRDYIYNNDKAFRAIYDDKDNLYKVAVYEGAFIKHIYRYTHPYYLVATKHEQYDGNNLIFYELIDYDNDANLTKRVVYKNGQLIYYTTIDYGENSRILEKIVYQYLSKDQYYITKFGSDWFFLNFSENLFNKKYKNTIEPEEKTNTEKH